METSPATSATCSSAISGTTHNLSNLADGVTYEYQAYTDSGCTTSVATETFATVLYPPTNLAVRFSGPPAPTTPARTRADWNRNDSTTGSVGYKVEKSDQIDTDFVAWGTIDASSVGTEKSYSGSTRGKASIRVRAFKTTGGVTVNSAWVVKHR